MARSRLAIPLFCLPVLFQCQESPQRVWATEVRMPAIDTCSVEEGSEILEGGFFVLDELLRFGSPQELEDRYGVGVLLRSLVPAPFDSCQVSRSYRLFDNGSSACLWQECECPNSRVRLGWVRTDSLTTPGEWRTRSGIYLGMPMDQVNILNGRAVSLRADSSGLLVSDSFNLGAFHQKSTGFGLGSTTKDSTWKADLPRMQGLHTRSRELDRFRPRVSSVWVWRVLE